jgi:predicted nuclease with TOPRIM domain
MASAEIKKIPAGPDEYSNEWYRQRLNAVEHMLGRLASEYVDTSEEVKKLRKQVNDMEGMRQRDAQAIGELMHRIECMEKQVERIEAIDKRMDAASQAVASLRRDANPSPAKKAG